MVDLVFEWVFIRKVRFYLEIRINIKIVDVFFFGIKLVFIILFYVSF